ncbi:transposase family protein, partial [Meiothermus sp. CFH 77666]
PSPIPYLMEVPDLRAHNTTYDWRLLFMLVLMGLGSGRTNLLAIAQWVQDQRDWLLSLVLGRRASGRGHPLSVWVGFGATGCCAGAGPEAMD